MTFDQKTFRRALGSFATGVTIVTGKTDAGELIGMTVSSFNSVSLNPPLVLFSLDRQAASSAHWERMEHYAVNVLDRAQLALCERFAKPGTDKWREVEHVPGGNGAPILSGSLAVFECRRWATYDGGDHIILVGEVQQIDAREDGAPLLFHGGAFKSVAGLEN